MPLLGLRSPPIRFMISSFGVGQLLIGPALKGKLFTFSQAWQACDARSKALATYEAKIMAEPDQDKTIETPQHEKMQKVEEMRSAHPDLILT